jgi:transposase InsO family protein
MTIEHGNADHVGAGPPATIRVCLDILLVHKSHVFQQKDVWFLVYDGSLPDAMLSETLLNNIPCIDSPGTTLVDTRARGSDLPILLQQMDDYQQLNAHRVNVARLDIARDQLTARVNAVLPSQVSPSSDAPAPSDSNASARSPAPSEPVDSASARTEHERISALLAEMQQQRARLMARLGKPISDEAFAACMSILDRYPDNFRPPGHDACKLGLYRIVLKDKSKFHIALPRRVNPIMLAEMRRQVEELVAQGAIERCTSRPASIYAIVMARRPNAPGKYRLCVDLVEGNANTVPEPYAIPEVQQALDRLSGKSIYSTFDFSSWFHQFEIAEEDRDKVAFVVPGDNLTPPQIYRYKRVAFGLMNATYFCQRQLQEALEKWPGCAGIFPFVDDIVIGSDCLSEHLAQLDSFMQFCRAHNIRLKKEKTELATSAVKHVGFILSKEGQSLDPARIDSLLAIGAPKNIEGLKSLLGSFGFIRAWLADCAKTAAPLTDLMSGTAKRMKLDWGPAQDAALAALKLACELAPAKMAPDYALPFHIFVDASDVGVAAVLVQFREDEHGNLQPFAIFHASRRWAPREAKWQIAEREMYAIRYGLFKFREYLQGCPNVTVHSDHLNLVNGLWKHSSPKIQRWRMFLESMRPFTLKHVSGTDRLQIPADALSRLHVQNLHLSAVSEEMDPETIRIMHRGEGDDDFPMFGDPIFKSASTQTSADECWEDIRAHNAQCAVHAPVSLEDRTLQQLYGIGFDLAARNAHAPQPTRHPRHISVADRITTPHLRLPPLQPAVVHGRQGIGFSSDYTSHKFSTNFYSEIKTPAPAATSNFTTSSASVISPTTIASETFVMDWVEDEENYGHYPRSCAGDREWCMAMFPASSQTSPQDYQDLARHQAGGFPLKDLLERAHDDTHPGFLCTWRRVIKALGPRPGRSQVSIKDEVKRYCDACLTCQKIRPALEKLRIKAGTIRGRPFSSYAFDIVTLSEPDSDGCRYILVCVDSFSRAVELFALKQANAAEVFQALNDVLCRWGTPHELRCDNAKAFTSSMVKALLSRSHVKQHLTAAYSHQSNGQVENCNRRVMDILRALIIDDRLGINTHTKWSLLLPQVRRVLMTRTVLQHGCTPNDLAYMHCPETEASIFENELWMPPFDREPSEPAWIAKLAKQHELLILICEEKQDVLIQKLAELNSVHSSRKLEVGDCALLKLTERPHGKVQAPWAGPYLVVSFPNHDADSQMVCCQHISNKKVSLLHLNMLKFCDMSLMAKIEDAIPYATKDSFEYEVAEVIAHRPVGPRKVHGVLRPKSDFEFQCLWKDIELSDENPSWEPWSNTSLRTCEAYLEYTGSAAFTALYGQKF